jgi:hypothetical protein
MLRSFCCQAPICLTLILRLTERITHRRKECFVIKRLHEKGDRANGHGGSARCQIFSRGDDNNARPRRERAHPGEDGVNKSAATRIEFGGQRTETG